ncbi:hypothetical protein CY34DRAFT_687116 [Suillus luteus UH-Slu-Lm8-n1]|uniref:Unplaced genomic scaffold CY34scaffold_749, whole genome shotgun sequence n=1 Tax=Suillus luteus UH-Slu-Lm8-n1 TaxID=930992 RepID=A0A0D0AHG1_9AGAM|nr:hypothetical protein CY34DRAFT_687116 [Suillus luteus UH-Slu-Lm8-n1]
MESYSCRTRKRGGCALTISRASCYCAGLEFCLTSAATTSCSGVTEGTAEIVVRGGIVNCLDAGSARSPLHVAALQGNVRCVEKLLESGALVHLRDGLGHTAFYYAARQGHAGIVDTLVSAGENLGGMENETGYVGHAVQNAIHAGNLNEAVVEIWRRAGVKRWDQFLVEKLSLQPCVHGECHTSR